MEKKEDVPHPLNVLDQDHPQVRQDDYIWEKLPYIMLTKEHRCLVDV